MSKHEKLRLYEQTRDRGRESEDIVCRSSLDAWESVSIVFILPSLLLIAATARNARGFERSRSLSKEIHHGEVTSSRPPYSPIMTRKEKTKREAEAEGEDQ